MSLLGIDVGTTGCKSCVFSLDGRLIASAYEEYDVVRSEPGYSELDVPRVWQKIKNTIKTVAAASSADPIKALAVSSLGEATVPVGGHRQIVGPSLLNDDARGEEFLEPLAEKLPNDWLYAINGNTLGNHYSLTKILWLKKHRPEVFEQAGKFLLWGSFVPFMLGAEPIVDYSLANRTLLFDLERQGWSGEILERVGLTAEKLPGTAPSGTAIGTVSPAMAEELGLPPGVLLATGAHDQCANALGCGAIEDGGAMLGMGTYLCLVPVFGQRPPASLMMPRGLNTEHHAVPGRTVSFIYNQGGSLLKWYRDTFAAAEHAAAKADGRDVYDELLAEMPQRPAGPIVLPHFTATGPPEFITDSSGVIAGLHLSTPRGEVLKAILEGTIFYLRESVESLAETGTRVGEVRAVGGGSKSARWVQLAADILGCRFVRTVQPEAGALGAAIMAGVACGAYASFEEGVEAQVALADTFEPDAARSESYDARFKHYARLYPALKDFLRGLNV